MPFSWQISINKVKDGGYVYAPVVMNPVAVSDEVIFTNNDDQPHWPGLVDITGTAANPTKYFMTHQIPPHTSSSTWIPGVNGTVTYADSLDPSESRPTGTIVVASPEPK
jgi:hypothetical protein